MPNKIFSTLLLIVVSILAANAQNKSNSSAKPSPSATSSKTLGTKQEGEKSQQNSENRSIGLTERFNNYGKQIGAPTLGHDLLILAYLGGGIVLIIFLVFLFHKKPNFGKQDSHGSATAANEDDLKEFTKGSNENLQEGKFGIGEKPNNKNSFYAVPASLTFRHILVLGPSGTGKSRGFYMPNLELLPNTGVSIFVNDTKGELWETTSGYWKNAYRFAPLEPDASTACNWIPLCTDENRTLTLKIARTIVTNGGENKSKEAFWDKAETALLAALFAHTATTDTPTPAYAYDLLHSYDAGNLTKILLDSESRLAREQARTFHDSGERVRGSVLIGARVSMTWLGDPKVRRFTSSTTKPIDFGSMLRKGKTGVFWCLPVKAITELRPLTCLVLVLAIEQLKELKGSPVYFMLDEFANIGAIPNFSTEITLLRSEKISVIAGIQSYGQLTERYGREASQTIIDNFATKIVLASLEYESAERISRHLGDTTVVEIKTSHTTGRSNSTTQNVQKHARRLLTANEITQISDREVLVISANRKPFFAEKWFFDKVPNESKPQSCANEITNEIKIPEIISTKNNKRKPLPEMPNFES